MRNLYYEQLERECDPDYSGVKAIKQAIEILQEV